MEENNQVMVETTTGTQSKSSKVFKGLILGLVAFILFASGVICYKVFNPAVQTAVVPPVEEIQNDFSWPANVKYKVSQTHGKLSEQGIYLTYVDGESFIGLDQIIFEDQEGKIFNKYLLAGDKISILVPEEVRSLAGTSRAVEIKQKGITLSAFTGSYPRLEQTEQGTIVKLMSFCEIDPKEDLEIVINYNTATESNKTFIKTFNLSQIKITK